MILILVIVFQHNPPALGRLAFSTHCIAWQQESWLVGWFCYNINSCVGSGLTMVPEIHITDENPPIFDLEWMDQCVDKV